MSHIEEMKASDYILSIIMPIQKMKKVW